MEDRLMPVIHSHEFTSPAIGHNNPPELSPFEAVQQEISDLFLEATNWADGTPIESDEQDAEVGRLIEKIRAAAKKAEALRVAEKKPLDDQVKAIQERYNVLIGDKKGKAALALDALKKVLAPWLKAKADAIAVHQRLAREAADAATIAAREAMQASAPTDLAARAAAEDLVQAAKVAARDASQADKLKPQSVGGERAIGLRTVWKVVQEDSAAALRHYRHVKPEALKAWLQEQAEFDVRAGKHEIPGFKITSEKVV
jgi:hypothetical protein